ncbi:BTAD domain-containing putative transcriptional regulator [Nonomuraea sp. NPDC049758]|uniref:AfsR/SARP family transcriptional regulator n=1 Tax=Nonomuraea sp. NPDC049758 TaxID=3154360 RepID=UPI0034229B6A
MADSTRPDGDGGQLRVGILGPLSLVTAGGPARVGGARLRGLLARLALDAGRAVRPETLAEALWDDAPPEAPMHALQSLVSRFRRVLGHPGLLTSGPAGYRLAVEPDAVDAVRFERLVRQGRAAVRDRPAEAAAILREALGLWRGPVLADVRAAPFAAAEADRLERARLAALEDRIEADLTLGAGLTLGGDPRLGADLTLGAGLTLGADLTLDGDPRLGGDLTLSADLRLGGDLGLVAELESLTVAHPLRERLHAQLIRALARDGRGAEALAAYQRIRARLADDFGGDPGPHLQQAHLAVLRGDLPGPHRPSRSPEPSGPPGPSGLPGPSVAFGPAGPYGPSPSSRSHGNLDVPLTSFVGRDEDVRRVTGLLGRARLVTLVGPGGAGKTRLAGAVGRRLTPSGGVWFVPLAAVGPDDVPRVLLDLLRTRKEGAPARAEPDDLVELLADDDLVLVLDNCEHVIEAAATLCGTLLGRCPRLRVLATSREPLRIDGEILHPVPPLDLPEPGSTPEAARSVAAVRLFRDRAAAVWPGFVLEGGALAATVEICRRLDGLPLAIELAAARLRALPVEAVAARLDDRFRLLTAGSRTALPRHRTLAAAVAWSWDLLDPGERSLLERLSVVRGSFTEAAAAAIGGSDDAAAIGGAGGVSELLAALVDKSLLHLVDSADPAEPRYRLLETIREYGLRRLAERAEVAATRDRHARFFLLLAEAADPHLRTSEQLRPLARLSAERDDLAAAIRWTVESGDAGRAVRFGVALSWYWFLRDFPPESLDLLGRVLQADGPADPRARALVAAAHAIAIVEAAGPEETDAAFDRIRTALAQLVPGTHPIAEMARLAVGIAAKGDHAVPAEGTDPWSRSLALLVSGVLAMNTGHLAEAKDTLARALAGFEQLGERWGQGMTLSALGSALVRSGAAGAAPALAEHATRCFRELGMPEHTMENEVAAALHRAESGDVDGGRRDLTGLLDRAGRSGSAESSTQARLGLARLELAAGRAAAAREHALAGLACAPPDRSTTPPLTALLLGVLARADLAEGFPDRAARRLDHPAVRLTLTWHTPVAAATAVVAAAIELGRDRPERAGRLLGAATVLGGWTGPGDSDLRRLTGLAEAALGPAGFAAAHAGGAAMSRAQAESLVTAAVMTPPS